MWDVLLEIGPVMGTIVFIVSIVAKYFPQQLLFLLQRQLTKVTNAFSIINHVIFPEYPNGVRSKAYAAVEAYVGSIALKHAARLRAEAVTGSSSLALSIDDGGQVQDDIAGIKVFWVLNKTPTGTVPVPVPVPVDEDRRHYELLFYNKHREFVLNSYIKHVMEEGQAIA